MANENMTVERICERLKVLGPFAFKSGNVVGEILAAHRREILAERNLSMDHFACLQGKIDAKDAEIKKRNALIKELADALNRYLLGECVDCGQFCKSDNMCDHAAKYRTLIAKARDIVK